MPLKAVSLHPTTEEGRQLQARIRAAIATWPSHRKSQTEDEPQPEEMPHSEEVQTTSNEQTTQSQSVPPASPKTVDTMKSARVALDRSTPLVLEKLTSENIARISKGAKSEIFKNAWNMGGYLCLESKIDFHKVQFSWQTLSAYTLWDKYSKGKDYLVVLNQCFPERLNRGIHSQLAATFDEVDVKFPLNCSKQMKKGHLDWGLASIINLVSLSFSDDRVDLPDSEAESRVSATQTKHGLQHFFRWQDAPIVNFGPFDGEINAERYNRINLLFHSLRLALSSSKATDTHLNDPAKCTLFTTNAVIPPNYRPQWLQPTKKTHKNTNTARVLKFTPKKFRLFWNRKAGSKDDREFLEDHLTHEEGWFVENGLDIVPIDTFVKTDPRACNHSAQWRDKLREQLSLWEMRLELAWIDLIIGDEKINIYGRLTSVPWADAQEIFNDRFPEIHLRLMPAGLQPGDVRTVEWGGAPPELEDFIAVDNEHRVALRETTPSSEHSRQLDVNDVLENTIPVPEAHEQPDTPFWKTGGWNLENTTQHNIFLEEIFADPLITTKLETVRHAGDKTSLSKKVKSFTEAVGNLHVDQELRADIDGLADMDINKDITQKEAEQLRTVQAAFAGGNHCVGPFVEDGRLALHMKSAGTYRDTDVPVFSCDLLPRCGRKFLDTQITAAAFLISKSFGFVPVFPGQDDTVTRRSARQRLECAPLNGAMVCDGTGLGKTLTTLLALAIVTSTFSRTKFEAVLPPPELKSDTNTNQNVLARFMSGGHLPSLLICPSIIVLDQWVKEIRKNFPELLFIVSADSKPLDSSLALEWVSSAQMKNPTKFPEHLKYIFDPNNPDASRTILLTVPATHSARVLKYAPGSSSDDYKDMECHWQGKFRIVVLDEAHKYRNKNTKQWWSIHKLEAQFHWMLTASPMVNNESDVLGLLKLLWPNISDTINKSTVASTWIAKQNDRGFPSIVRRASKFRDERSLCILDPRVTATLFENGDLVQIAEVFPLVAKQVMVSRTKDSLLPLRYDDDERLDLSAIMKPHWVRTIQLTRRPDEEAESQFWHLISAQMYDAAVRDMIPDGSGSSASKSFPAVTAPLRKMAIASASTKLARLDAVLEQLNIGSLVDSMEKFQARGYGIDWMISLVWKEADGPYPRTLQEQLRFMTDGSPLCRYLYGEYSRLHPLGENMKKKKILVIEDVPLIAWFWEVMSKAIGINMQVMYSGTDANERQKMVDDFRRVESGLHALGLLYSVGGAQGTNLDDDCFRALVLNMGISSTLEIQAWARIIRVSQEEMVNIIRVLVKNSFSQIKEARQMDKSVVQLACRSGTEDVQNVLVALLNKYNIEVRDAKKKLAELSTDEAAQEGALTSPNEDVEMVDAPEVVDETADPAVEDASVPRSKDLVYHDMDVPENSLGDEEYNLSEHSGDEDVDLSDHSENEDDGDNEVMGLHEIAVDFLEDHFRTNSGSNANVSSRGAIKEHFKSLTPQARMAFDSTIAHLRLLAQLDPNKNYTIDDLADKDVLERGLRLLFRERYGIKEEVFRLGMHLNYTHLNADIINRLNSDEAKHQQKLAKIPDAAGLLKAKLPRTVTKRKKRSRTIAEEGPVKKPRDS